MGLCSPPPILTSTTLHQNKTAYNVLYDVMQEEAPKILKIIILGIGHGYG